MEETLMSWDKLIANMSFGILYFLVFFFAKWVHDLTTPYSVDEELTAKDNPALALSLAGYFSAVTIVYLSALMGPSQGLGMDLITSGGYALLGIALLGLSYVVNDKLIFSKFHNIKEIIEDQNLGTGSLLFGTYLASGLIAGASVHGEGGGPLTVIVSFALGQFVLVIFSKVYNLVTPFCIHEEIEQDNVALGVALGGNFIALSIIVMAGIGGSFITWQIHLMNGAISATLALVSLPVIRFLFAKLILRHANLNEEIQRDRNIGVAFLEASSAISFSFFIYFLW